MQSETTETDRACDLETQSILNTIPQQQQLSCLLVMFAEVSEHPTYVSLENA
jgi:hypothetical protein